MSSSDDGGGILIPLGPGAGTSTTIARQFSSRTAAFLRSFAENPVRFIFSAISLYLLDGIFGIFGVIAGSVLAAYDIVVGALGFVQGFLVAGFGAVGIDILGALTELQLSVAGVVEGAGPAGPIVAVGAAAAGTYLSYRLGRFVVALLNPT